MTRSPTLTDTPPTLVALHFLGGRAELWTPLFEALGDRVRPMPIDLPGFGDAVDVPGYDVAAMAEYVAAAVARAAPPGWLLVGHSMGAKVACVVARMAEDGAPGLDGLAGLILVAGSPPSPEPMKETKRDEMRSWFAGSPETSRKEADRYIRDNVAHDLPDPWHADAVGSVLSLNRNAWLAWLDAGSREDWADRVGQLATPALILAGSKDAALGPEAQRTAMLPHFDDALVHVLPDTGHLIPLEQPDAAAAAIRTFVGAPVLPEPDIPAGYRALIESPRVSGRTRTVLVARAQPVPTGADVLSAADWRTLRALSARLIPQTGERQIDIAGRMIHRLTVQIDDGWRFAELPPNVQALRLGLSNLDAIAQTLDAAGFAFLPVAQQDALLTALAAGKLTSPLHPDQGRLPAHELELWFEDMRSLATQVFLAHPVTQARIGFSGIANRGDGTGPQGFTAVGLGARELWEPVAETGAVR